MTAEKTLTIDGVQVALNGEKNLLEVIRGAHIELPTFCYHSELSVYGACRLCMVEVEGRGLVAACSAPVEPGLKIKTQSAAVRELRKVNLELLLASGQHDCPTCDKSGACKLQSLSERLGVRKVRFKAPVVVKPLDTSSASLVRDPNKCVLCGDCVRYCSEIQGIGVLEFSHRGSNSVVTPAFGKGLKDVECVLCGQCASVCPTGAITVKSEIEKVHASLENPKKTVVVQIAPAVRAAIGEAFNLPADTHVMGKLVASLRRLGFDKVYDTAFAADLTILEEANEFVARKKKGEDLPLFTSCCPAWVKLAEQDFPELLPHTEVAADGTQKTVQHISSCRSPQGMFSSLAKDVLPKEFGIDRKDLVVVSIMPCTAKKFEAQRPELGVDGSLDTDCVLTTQEAIRMIKDAGIALAELDPESLDMPFGAKSGAGVIFGNSGGVTEAVLRYAAAELEATPEGRAALQDVVMEVRKMDGVREFTANLSIGTIKGAVVHGLANTRKLVRAIKEGKAHYDFVEVMSCPNGCVNGGGQPVAQDSKIVAKRREALRHIDASLDFHRSQDNLALTKCYEDHIGGAPNSHKAHHLLHTVYQNRKRIANEPLALGEISGKEKIPVTVCVGTGCQLRGAQELLRQTLKFVDQADLTDYLDIRATFCMEACDRGPSVTVNGVAKQHCSLDDVKAAIAKALEEHPDEEFRNATVRS